ncbi:MAG TPA: aminotransferase class I/II-fold pyridoxal phosphate-dependent enzyme [Gaiellaceae bacterium]
MIASPTFEVSLDELRRRRSVKWSRYPEDVLPAWVAEMDFALAPPVQEALRAAVDRSDAGYADSDPLPAAFAEFAQARYGWTVDSEQVLPVADILTGIGITLDVLTEPGDGVVVNPPVYPPFFTIVRDRGREIVAVPLRDDWRLDLDGLERAFARGARIFLLCNPHNPTGTVFTREELAAVAALARQYGVLVLSDEVHAPMTLPGAEHTPYLSLGEGGVAFASASKAWNVAGLKCAVVVAGSEETLTAFGRVPGHVHYQLGHYGVLATLAAFRDGMPWLDGLNVHLDAQRGRLVDLLADELPQVQVVRPEAGYLVWLDCRELGLGDDPSAVFLERGRVALSPGPTFGVEGNGFARLNVATSADLLAEAVRRMASCAS